MQRVRDECGERHLFQLAGSRSCVVRLARHPNFPAGRRRPGPAKAYQTMTLIFGEGVVFDAKRTAQRRCRHAATRAADEGPRRHHRRSSPTDDRRLRGRRPDLLDFFAEPTIYTFGLPLIGKKSCDQLDGRFSPSFPRVGARHRPTAWRRPVSAGSRASSRRDEARKVCKWLRTS